MLLDQQLRPTIVNPHPPGNRQLTALEANYKRLCTIMRHVSERRFASIKDFKIMAEKLIPTEYFDEIGPNLLPDHPHIVKFELILHCVLSLVEENWEEFMQKWLPPPGMTEAQCGVNMRQRLHKRCSLDPTEQVTYNVNFDRFNQRQWNPPCAFDNHATLAFPQFVMADMTIVTLGSYGIKMADGYITSMQHHWIMEEIENLGVADPDIDWDDWNFLHCAFPSDKTVYWYDQDVQPLGWDVNVFGPFIPRRVLLITLPSRHRRDTYKVLIDIYWFVCFLDGKGFNKSELDVMNITYMEFS